MTELTLTQLFKQAANWLDAKSTHPIPCYIILGAKNSGKTRLLSAAGLTAFNNSEGDPLLQDHPKETITWWRHKTAAFLEIADTISSDTQTQTAIVKQLQAYEERHPIAGLLLCIDVSTLQANSAKPFAALLQLINGITQQPLPLHLIFTHSDQLTGFNVYCNNLDTAERRQAWGIKFTTPPSDTAFAQACSNFLNPLHQQILTQMHRTYLRDQREALNHLPSAVQKILQTTQTLIKNNSTGMPLGGLYFTANNTRSFTTELVDRILSLSPITNRPTAPQQATNKANQFRLWAVGLAGITLLVGGFIAYQYNRYANHELRWVAQALQPTDLALSSTKAATDALPPLVNELNRLQQAAELAHQAQTRHFATRHFGRAKHLAQLTADKYRQALTTKLQPYLQHTLETALYGFTPSIQANDITASRLSYHYLQAYLELTRPTRMNETTALKQVFSHQWAMQPQSIRLALLQHVDDLIKYRSLQAMPKEDAKLITQTQQALSKLPMPALILTIATSDLTDPYTIKNLESVYGTGIEQATTQLMQGDPILGGITPPTGTATDDALMQQARTRYLTEYKRYWRAQLDSLMPDPTSTIKKVDTALDTINSLLNETSSLRKQLGIITVNVAPQPRLPAFNAQVSQQFTPLTDLLLDLSTQQATYKTLTALQAYLAPLQHAEKKSRYKMALQMTTKRLKSADNNSTTTHLNPLTQLHRQADSLSAPCQQWLHLISDLAWQGLLDLSRQALNDAWQTTVLNEYKQQLAQRYPLFKKSSKDLKLKAFIHFFGPQGTLHTFYTTYMQPFINRQGAYWVWKDVDGAHLTLPQTTLEMFMRGELIRQMYFPTNKPYPHAKFTLAPTALMPSVERLALAINGQHSEYTQHAAPSSLSFTWPSHIGLANVQFVNNTGKIITVTKTGLWAWFRLLDVSRVQPTADLKRYHLLLDINGNSAKYEILTDTKLNPLSLDIIGSFRCPETL